MMKIELPEERIKGFCRKWKIVEFSLFGCVLREDFRPDSDVDVMVSFIPGAGWSLLDVVEMERELGEALGHRVDLVERSAVERSDNYIRRRHSLNSSEPVYVAR
jgi:hypothetical protein